VTSETTPHPPGERAAHPLLQNDAGQEDAGAAPALRGRSNITVDAARRDLARRFRDAGIDSPALDARILVGHALGLDLTALMRAADRRLAAGDLARLETLAVRRLGREPVARIIGWKEFWGLPFQVTPAVLVPRPETETAVEQALAAIDRTGARSHPLRVADLGTGSGAILAALLTELPNAMAVGTDRDVAALAVARENARRLGVASRAAFAACDFGAAVAPGCDLVVTNPPYVRTDDIAALEPEVRGFDPRGALDGGCDGLAAYRIIAADTGRILGPGAHLIAEIGSGQGPAVAALFAAAGFGDIAIASDLAGVERVVTARRTPERAEANL
jgi:release factor glutamine methyltransferase